MSGRYDAIVLSLRPDDTWEAYYAVSVHGGVEAEGEASGKGKTIHDAVLALDISERLRT
jgi:hypothetical protein